MFQDFTSSSDPTLGAERVAKLRARLKKLGVDAVIVPRFDEHMGEYVPPSAERLAWLTGFTGSAGWAIIGQDKAALFVDGRYTLQAPTQVPTFKSRRLRLPSGSSRRSARVPGSASILGCTRAPESRCSKRRSPRPISR
jgi:hypothetical protein